MTDTAPVGRQSSLLLALVVGTLGAGVCAWSAAHAAPGTAGDFDHLWVAARAFLESRDPYQAVRDWGWRWPVYYPFPAIAVVAWVVWLPLEWARALFAGIGAGWATYALARRGRWALWLLLAPPFANAVVVGQWSPYFFALALTPTLQGFYCLKPSVGAALWLMRPSWRVVVAGAVITAVTVLYVPWWPAEWWAAAQQARAAGTHVPPVALTGGVLLLLAALRWRRPEARLLLGLALIPHSMLLYETLLLAHIVQTKREAQLFALCTAAAELGVRWVLTPEQIAAGGPVFFAAVRPVYLALVYLPLLMLVLRRPNEAPGAGPA